MRGRIGFLSTVVGLFVTIHGVLTASRTGPAEAESQSELSSEIDNVVNQSLATGRFPGLTYPTLGPYAAQLADLYRGSPHALLWLQAGRPTPQAVAMIALLQNADRSHQIQFFGPCLHAWDSRRHVVREISQRFQSRL